VVDDLLEMAGGVVAALLQGCFVSFAIVALSAGAIVAFATGHAHEGWTQVGLLALCIVWAIMLIGHRIDRHRSPQE
jgi:hypothetical protein